MENEARCPARLDPAEPTVEPTVELPAEPTAEPTAVPTGGRPDADPAKAAPIGRVPQVDWLTAQAELDECDGYIVLAVDPQTGEVDAHGPYPGFDALEVAESLRRTLDHEELDDVVVRVVRWHQESTGAA
jgi:PT repeat